MFAMSLVDSSDRSMFYGMLICENNEVTGEKIQNKIYEIKDNCFREDEWTIEDIIEKFPQEWNIHLQKGENKIII